MTEAQILTMFHDNPFGVAARSIKWVFSTCETVHFIGLCVLFGALLMFDLRMLGVLRRGTMKSALNYTHVAAFGLSLNVASGFILFSSNPKNYWTNPAFRLKMCLLLIAIANVIWFEVVERRKVLAMVEGADTDVDTKMVAGLSLLLWAGVLICGRWLPVTALGGG